MPVQFIGAIGSSGGSESRVAQGPIIDKTYLGAIARTHEAARPRCHRKMAAPTRTTA